MHRNNAYSNIIIVQPTRKNNILDVFLNNSDQPTRQIIITETSISDHNIIQMKTNINILEKKQHHQIKKRTWTTGISNTYYLFNNTSWDRLLTDVKINKSIYISLVKLKTT